MEIIVGRKGQQQAVITDLTVSREHCKLTDNGDGTYTVENLSANGTFVDGKSIIRTVVTADTVITLGANYSARVKDLWPFPPTAGTEAPGSGGAVNQKEEPYQQQFRDLKQVYEQYMEKKITLQKEANLKNFYRSLPSAIMAILFAVSLFGGEASLLAQIRPWVGIAMIFFIGLTTFQVYNGQKELPAKMEALNKQFMIDYVCPRCGNFLGFVPFETLQNKKQCSFCKCKWVC